MLATQQPAKTHGTYAAILGVVEGQLSVIMIENKLRDGTRQWKLPGGTNRLYTGHREEDTLDRTIEHEVGVVFGAPMPMPSLDRNLGNYTQKFYMIRFEDCKGSFRTGEIEETKGVLGLPTWVPTEEALGDSGRTILLAHREPLLKAVNVYKAICEL